MDHVAHVWRWRQHRFRTDWRCRVSFWLTALGLISAMVAAGVVALGFA